MKKLAILLADMDEFRGLLPLLEQRGATAVQTPFPAAYQAKIAGVSCLFLCFGVGKTNAAAGGMYVALNGYDTALNYGYSGGLSGVAKGQLFVALDFAEHDFDLTDLGYGPCCRPGEETVVAASPVLCEALQRLCPTAAVGRALSGDCFVCDEMRRAFLRDSFDGMTCDMESAALARVFAKTGVAFGCLRLVSDDAGQDAKTSYRESLHENRSLNERAMDVITHLCEELS